MTNAIDAAFSDSNRLACTRHIKEKVIRQLRDNFGCRDSLRQQLVRLIFGERGLAAAHDDFTFEIREKEVTDVVNSTVPQFTDYFKKQVVQLLWMNLDTKQRTGLPSTDRPWTNNNAESANHILKMATQWKSKSLVEVIDILHDMVQGQY